MPKEESPLEGKRGRWGIMDELERMKEEFIWIYDKKVPKNAALRKAEFISGRPLKNAAWRKST